ncbi:M56 family metallopeptidase [Haloimpatiens sp. FM7330]|uniref:M56 family metallopeptidase n=1 Tax=Haloimpatiens sp. FM7330 TaxID=3298610 RepID=UPI00363FE124
MISLTIIIYALFKLVVYSTIIGSILALLIFIQRLIVKNKLGVRFQYMVWFILVLRLVIPIFPKSSFSILNFIPMKSEKPNLIKLNNEFYLRDLNMNILNRSNVYNKNFNAYGMNYNENLESCNLQNNYNNIIEPYVKKNSKGIYYLYCCKEYLKNFLQKEAVFLIWISVVVILTIYILVSNIRFYMKISRKNSIDNDKIINIFINCKKELNIKRNISLIESEKIKSPMLIGIFKPKIVIPFDLHLKTNITRVRYVLLHELIHFKRKDIFINCLTISICILHWFNPLLWYAFYKMRQDCELCCDNDVLYFLKTDEIKEYGYTIIDLLKNFHTSPKNICTAGIIKSKSQAKKRIIIIKAFKKRSFKFSLVSFLVLLLFSMGILTDAKAVQFNSDNLQAPFKQVIGINGELRVVDKIEYPYVNDSEIVGKWVSVDFVNKISDFNPNEKQHLEELYLKEMNFYDEGKTEYTWCTWTKGIIIHHEDYTVSEYIIKKINGKKYMFFQWKSGDYVFRYMEPKYYVLKKVE